MLPIQVLIVEDDPMARTLFEIYLKNSEKYKVAGSVGKVRQWAELYCLTKQIDLILMDVVYGFACQRSGCSGKNQKESSGDKNPDRDQSAGM